VRNSVPAGLLQHLACPRDHLELHDDGENLRCSEGHTYPVVDGVPVFLLPGQSHTIGFEAASYQAAVTKTGAPLYLDTLGLSDDEKAAIASQWGKHGRVDPAVSYLVAATSGYAYKAMLGNMQEYPVPAIPLSPGNGRLLLDVGCSWGRWTVSAGRKGWRAIGIDPSLGAIMAAKRAFEAEGLPVWFVCGDARALPFKTATFDCVFSYSVLQHFSEPDAHSAIGEVGRVLHEGGEAKVQMAQKWGLRSTYVRTRQNYLSSGIFRVRYWSIPQLRQQFEAQIGPSRVQAEAFGGLGLLREDFKVVSPVGKGLIAASTVLRAIASVVKPLSLLADSVYVTSRKVPKKAAPEQLGTASRGIG
jgi:SAM-dependent methyltransferase/uncharacterized protein YbaR (Trm112 family)